MEEIGSGSQAVVYKGKWQGTMVALKEVRLDSVGMADAVDVTIRREIRLHADLRHPNVVSFFGLCRNVRSITMVTELMDMSLAYLMFETEKEEKLRKDQKMFVAAEVLKGIVYIHGKNIVHGDLKPPNILLSCNATVVKICDLGLSRVKASVRDSCTVSPKKGTYLYMSPEIILSNIRCSFHCDMWALGATFAELFSETDIWKIPSDSSKVAGNLKRSMKTKAVPPALKALKRMDDDMHTALSPCMSYVPTERPSPIDLLDHIEQLMKKNEPTESGDC